MPKASDKMFLAKHVIPLYENYANITLFQHDYANAIRLTERDTVNYPRTNKIAFINDLWPAKSQDLNPIENKWDNLGKRERS